MIEIRYDTGGEWVPVSRDYAIKYVIWYVFRGETKNLRRKGFFALKYFNKKLIRGTQFTGKELRRCIDRNRSK